MISLNIIRFECAQLICIALSRSNAYGQNSRFTHKGTLHRKSTIITVYSRQITTSATSIATTQRLKREDVSCIKHDPEFSEWMILAEGWDGKYDSMGKQGAERKLNLPNFSSCAGVYELGIATISRNLELSSVVTVYTGHTHNARDRLMQYARDGAHLGLFFRTLPNDLLIVFRVASKKSKEEAEKLESELLEMYDYAWNRRNNGKRRPHDIHKKLDEIARISLPCKVLQHFNQKQAVDRTETKCDLFSGYISFIRMVSRGIFSRIFRIGIMYQPKQVQSAGFRDDSEGICGVATGNGSVCMEPPVQGRKRCAAHKGKKINGFASRDRSQNQRLKQRIAKCKPCASEYSSSNENSCSSW